MSMVPGRPRATTDVRTAIRNHYFYGKLLDAYHFELETNYHNAKRWLLNRRVSGYGVICGLDVRPGDRTDEIYVTAGLAIDRWGRELVVPQELGPITVPPEYLAQTDADARQQQQQAHGGRRRQERHGFQVVLCYHECLAEPAPVLAGDCHTVEPCQPGIIREQVSVGFRHGLRPPPEPQCLDEDFIQGTRLNWSAVVAWVTRACPPLNADPCLPLANITTDDSGGHGCNRDNIDIDVRPIVWTNDLLFELIMSLAVEEPRESREK
jgi:hypothetical protein